MRFRLSTTVYAMNGIKVGRGNNPGMPGKNVLGMKHK